MKAVNKFQGYEHVKVTLEATPRGTGMSFTKLRNILKDPNATPEQQYAVWSQGFDEAKLGKDWILHLMDITRKGMGITQPPKQQPVQQPVPVAETRLFNALVRPVTEARMSAAVKLQRAFDRERAKSDASRRRGEEVMAQAKADAEKKNKEQGVAEGIDIGKEWMSDTELDQYVPDHLQQKWRELLGYDMNGNPSALWANLTGGYEPDVNDPQHRALMVKVANKWFAAKKIPNVKFFDVKDADDELEWLVQIGEQGVAEGDSGAKYKVRSIGHDAKGDYYVSPSTGEKVYKKAKVGDHEVPGSKEIKPKVKEAESQAISHTAKSLENPPKVMQHRARRDQERERQWMGTQIAKRDTTSKDEWGNLKEKQRLDPKCWTGYKKQGTKMKGGVRVNNCVPVSEDIENIMDVLVNKIIMNEAIQNNK